MLNWIGLYSVNMLLSQVKEQSTPYTKALASANKSALLARAEARQTSCDHHGQNDISLLTHTTIFCGLLVHTRSLCADSYFSSGCG